MQAEYEPIYGPFYGERCLNFGSGFSLEKGNGAGRAWTNMDFNPACGAEVVHDLRKIPWPFPDNSFDTVQCSHIMEHFWGDEVIRIAKEVSRILRVGGHWVVVVPYGNHRVAWHNPHHKQRWDENTICYLSRSLYGLRDGKITAGTGAHHNMEYAEWSIAALTFRPDERWRGKPDEEIRTASERYHDVIEEMHFALKLEEK